MPVPHIFAGTAGGTTAQFDANNAYLDARCKNITSDNSNNVTFGSATVTNAPISGVAVLHGDAGVGNVATGHPTATASGAQYASYAYGGVIIGSITQSGTTGVLFNVTSDARLKFNVAPALDAGALLDAVEVRQFDWVPDGSHQRYGFIAQELLAVVPEAVHVPVEPSEMMAVDYSKLVPLLVKEVQSLRARVAALEAA